MRLSQIITETVETQLQYLAKNQNTTPEEITNTCKQINRKYWKWVLNQWYRHQSADGGLHGIEPFLFLYQTRMQKALDNFEKVYSRIPIDQKDISKYKSVAQIEDLVEPMLGIQSTSKIHENFEEYPGVEVILKTGPFTTIKISDPESLSELGEGTKWCTRKSYQDPLNPRRQAENHNKYIREHGHVYAIFMNNRPVAQYTPNYVEIKDIKNDPITDPKILSLIPEPPLKQILKQEEKIKHQADGYTQPSEYKPALTAYKYALNVIQGKWPKGEPYIIKYPLMAYQYAKDVVEGRWPEAEASIMQDPRAAVAYAQSIINGRWPEAEPYIMEDSESASKYAREVIGGRWPEAEPYIMKNPFYGPQYAKNTIKGRWPEAETYLLNNPDPAWAFNYALAFNRRWPEAEPIIIKSPMHAYNYAQYIINGRWPEAEPTIIQNPKVATFYASTIIRDRWPEAEPTIMQDPASACTYAQLVIKGRWPEAEPYIMNDPHYAKKYTDFIMNWSL